MIVEYRCVEFFEHLSTSRTKSQTLTNEESQVETTIDGGSQMETSPKVVEQEPSEP